MTADREVYNQWEDGPPDDEWVAAYKRMRQLFRIIVSEFKSDPMSVQCFDLRIVHEAIALDAKIEELDK